MSGFDDVEFSGALSMLPARLPLSGWQTKTLDCDASVFVVLPDGMFVRRAGDGALEVAPDLNADVLVSPDFGSPWSTELVLHIQGGSVQGIEVAGVHAQPKVHSWPTWLPMDDVSNRELGVR